MINKQIQFVALFCFIGLACTPLQAQDFDADTTLLNLIRRESSDRSQVMKILGMLTDVNGPRLTNSPGYKRATQYCVQQLKEWGAQNVTLDQWDEVFGRGWELKKFHLTALTPSVSPLIAWPKAWSPGVKGSVRGEVVFLNIEKESDIENYRGKLKNKFVLLNFPATVRPSFKADAWRLADSTLEEMSNAEAASAYRGRRFSAPTEPQRLAYLKWELCKKEGVLAVIEASSRLEDDGTLVVSAATVPYPAEVAYARRLQSWDSDAPEILPQMVMNAEHYNRLVRQSIHGIAPTLELTFDVAFSPAAPGYNVIGEIPGTDLKDEVVMIGAHLDSWHSANGTTDNAVGSAVMLETIRILKSLGQNPRRTIRIALWGGEEQGLLGSKSYVRRKLGERLDESYPYDSIRLTSAGENLSVYFNMDNGTGKYRGVYLQGNEAALPVFKDFVTPFAKDGSSTLTLLNTSGTDHLSFDALGLPAFQFIQDPIEYGTRTHHTNMDLYDKAVEDDLKHNAAMTAWLVWKAANRDQKIPKDPSR